MELPPSPPFEPSKAAWVLAATGLALVVALVVLGWTPLLVAALVVAQLPGRQVYEIDAAGGDWPGDESLPPSAKARYALRGVPRAALMAAMAHVLLPLALLADLGVVPRERFARLAEELFRARKP